MHLHLRLQTCMQVPKLPASEKQPSPLGCWDVLEELLLILLLCAMASPTYQIAFANSVWHRNLGRSEIPSSA
jgi:hypothetical protein